MNQPVGGSPVTYTFHCRGGGVGEASGEGEGKREGEERTHISIAMLLRLSLLTYYLSI